MIPTCPKCGAQVTVPGLWSTTLSIGQVALLFCPSCSAVLGVVPQTRQPQVSGSR